MSHLRFLSLALLIGMLALPIRPQLVLAQDSLRAAAVVNDEIISILDVVMRIRLAIVGAGVQDTPQAREKIGPQILQKLIDERLQLQEAERLEIEIAEQEVRAAIASLAQQNDVTPEQFLAVLRQNRIAPEVLVEQIKADISWRQVVRLRLGPSVVVSDDDVEAVVNRILASEDSLQYRVSEIFLAVPEVSREAQVQQNAEKLLSEIRGGANFSGLAREFSESRTAQLGGDLGWIDAGQLSRERAAALAQLQPGQVSAPIRTIEGISLLYLRDTRERSEEQIDRDTIRKELQEERVSQLARRSLQELRRAANIDIRI